MINTAKIWISPGPQLFKPESSTEATKARIIQPRNGCQKPENAQKRPEKAQIPHWGQSRLIWKILNFAARQQVSGVMCISGP